MGLFSFINLKKRKRITLLVVDLDKIIKGAGKQKTRAIPYKSARESGERFFVRKRWKTAGILCVFQGFPNESLAEKIRQNPQTHLCGVALAQFTWISSLLRLMRFPVYSWNSQIICISKCGLLGRIFTFVWNNSFPGDSTPQMCRQPTADLFRRKFVIFSCHTQSMPAKNCLFPAQNLWLIARRQFMRCCPKRKKTPASNQWVMDTGASRMIYMISVMLLFFQRTQKSPAWTCNQTGLWNVILAGEGFGSKNNSKLRDDIYFVVKAWKNISISEYLIFCGEKGWYLRGNTTKAPISRCFCSWHLFCPV